MMTCSYIKPLPLTSPTAEMPASVLALFCASQPAKAGIIKAASCYDILHHLLCSVWWLVLADPQQDEISAVMEWNQAVQCVAGEV